MTTKEQKDYWFKFHRFQMRYELMYMGKINQALKDQVQQYVKYRDTVYIRSSGLYGVLMDLYKNTGAVWARHTNSGLYQKQVGQMGFSERIVTLMQQMFGYQLLNDAENITQTTIRLIGEVLSDAALEGWSFDQIVAKLVAPDFTAIRARLIARTETVGAANAGSLLNANATGLPLNKIWIAARDSRTRDHHREVNQTVIPKDDNFKVGDSLMQYPGDKAGSAAEVCNCRCAIAFIPVDNKAEIFEQQQKGLMEPFFEGVNESVTNLSMAVNGFIKKQNVQIIESNVQAIQQLTKAVDNIGELKIVVPAPEVTVNQPEIKISQPVLNQDAVISSIEQAAGKITEVGNKIVDGQIEIVKLLNKTLEPKPKKKWRLKNVIENGRIVESIAEEI